MILVLTSILAAAKPKVETLFFVTSDCPIANRYTPEIKRIIKDYSSVSTFQFEYEDTGVTTEKLKAHHNEYAIQCPFSLDAKHRLAHMYAVKGVPTVVVRVGAKVLYQGRIDDSYGNDFHWRPVKQRDLRNTLTAIRDGKTVPVKSTKVIGCALGE